MLIPEAITIARGGEVVEFHGCLGLNYVPIPDWSSVWKPVLLKLHELEREDYGAGFPKGKLDCQYQDEENGFCAGKRNRSPLMLLSKDPEA